MGYKGCRFSSSSYCAKYFKILLFGDFSASEYSWLWFAMERSPVNSASFSMLPWPKPTIWPSIPSDASSEVLAKEKMNLQVTPRVK
ncbi:hypothetical protein Tco_1185019 [Tanacetum coccineum]